MESKVVDPVASAVGDRPKDNIINSTNTQECIAALMKGTNALTLESGKKKGAAQQLKNEDASIGASAGAAAAAASSLSGFSEKKPSSIVKPAKKHPQPAGAVKKCCENIRKDSEPFKEKAKCKGKKSESNAKINGSVPEPPLSPAIGSAQLEDKKRSVGGKGMGAAPGMNRESVRARLARKMAERNLEAVQKEADFSAKNDEAERLDLEMVSKMSVGDKQELFKKHLTHRVRCIHPALCEKLMSMIMVCADHEIIHMANDQAYLVVSMQKAVAKLHETGYYDRAKNDEVFNPSVANAGGKLRRK